MCPLTLHDFGEWIELPHRGDNSASLCFTDKIDLVHEHTVSETDLARNEISIRIKMVTAALGAVSLARIVFSRHAHYACSVCQCSLSA